VVGPPVCPRPVERRVEGLIDRADAETTRHLESVPERLQSATAPGTGTKE
jgi:hypothetical protein